MNLSIPNIPLNEPTPQLQDETTVENYSGTWIDIIVTIYSTGQSYINEAIFFPNSSGNFHISNPELISPEPIWVCISAYKNNPGSPQLLQKRTISYIDFFRMGNIVKFT